MESKVITYLTQWNTHPTMPWGHKTQYTFSKQQNFIYLNIKKQRHYLSMWVHLLSYGFSSGCLYGCESWNIKKAKY